MSVFKKKYRITFSSLEAMFSSPNDQQFHLL